MLWTLLLLSPAEAARDRALIYMGHAAPPEYNWGEGSLDDLTSGLRRMGAAGVDEATSWPADLDDYALVILFLSQNTYKAGEAADLVEVTDAGGLVVMVTDNEDFVPYAEGVFNNLLAQVGSSARFSDWPYIGSYDGACRADTALVDHMLTRGQPLLQWALAVSAHDGSGTSLYANGIVVLDGPWLLVGDVNIMAGGCDGQLADNSTFFENLWNFGYGGTCQETDRDGDGFDSELCGGDDCDDADDAVNPGSMRYEDADGDGHGNPERVDDACSAPSAWVEEGDDCVDDDASTLGDEGPFYVDADDDGYGDPDAEAFACTLGSGLSESRDDCDDDDDEVHPDAEETCDGRDEDCDDDVDEEAVDAPVWYYDGDEDGYGDPDEPLAACERPEGYVEDATDCADGDPTTYPGSPTYADVCGDLIAGDTAAGDPAAAGCFCDGLGAAFLAPVGFLAAGLRRRRSASGRRPERGAVALDG